MDGVLVGHASQTALEQAGGSQAEVGALGQLLLRQPTPPTIPPQEIGKRGGSLRCHRDLLAYVPRSTLVNSLPFYHLLPTFTRTLTRHPTHSRWCYQTIAGTLSRRQAGGQCAQLVLSRLDPLCQLVDARHESRMELNAMASETKIPADLAHVLAISSEQKWRPTMTRSSVRLYFLIALMLVASLAVLSACTAGSTTTNTGNNSTPSATTTATPKPTVTPKPKPTSIPAVTLAFCQRLLSIAEANQIMRPAKPAIMIIVTPVPSGGLCTYSSSPSPAGLVVQIRIGLYSGVRPIPQQNVEAYFKQGLNQPGVTVLTVTPVSGMGDQAGIVVGSYTISGTTVYGAAVYVLFGNVVFECGNLSLSSPTAPQRAALQQCAQLVVGRL